MEIYFLFTTILLIDAAIGKKLFDQPCEESKVKYGQLGSFFYLESCSDSVNSQNALLGSGTFMDCGVFTPEMRDTISNYPVLIFGDLADGSTNFVRSFCINTHGVDSVTVTRSSLSTELSTQLFKDVEDADGWTRFCIEKDMTDIFAWQVKLVPKFDGSRVMAKNTKLAVCRFLIENNNE